MNEMKNLANALSGKKPKKDPNQWLVDAVTNQKHKHDDDVAITKMLNKVDHKENVKADALKIMKETFDHIYVLYVKELENSYFYVGRTKGKLKTRLNKHLSESKTGTSKKCVGIRQIVDEGLTIGIELLETLSLTKSNEGKMSESEWISQLESSGIELLNSQDGESARFEPVIDMNKAKHIWNPKDFNIAWTKDGSDAKKGEWYTKVNGIDFYRKGWSKLRFERAGHSFECGGMVWDICVNNAVAHFTEGTDQHKRMIDTINCK